jgi:hypothetical protein
LKLPVVPFIYKTIRKLNCYS